VRDVGQSLGEQQLIPVINDLNKKIAIAETAQAIQDVSRWWP
jgi:hypothetical protein